MLILFSVFLEGIPLVIIHFRDDTRIPPIVIFIIALLLLTFGMSNDFDNPFFYLGSLAMVVALIMACAYPKEKYWD